MSRRLDQINELLRGELASAASGGLELDGCLVTILYVKTSPDLKNATVGISVLPENMTGSALKELRRRGGAFGRELGKKMKIKKIPRFNWVIDKNIRRAQEIEDCIKDIHEQ